MKKTIALWIILVIWSTPASTQVNNTPALIWEAESLVFLVEDSIQVSGRFFDKTRNSEKSEAVTGVFGTAFQINETDILTVEHVLKDVAYHARNVFAKAAGNLAKHGIEVGVWPQEITGIRHVFKLTASDGSSFEFSEHYTASWSGKQPTKENIEKFVASIEKIDIPTGPRGFTVIARNDQKDIALIRLSIPRELPHYISLPLPFEEVDMDIPYWGLSAQTGPRCNPFCYNARKGLIVNLRPSTYILNDLEWREARSWHIKMITRPGDSGGPVVNEQLALLGLTHAGDAFANMMAMFDIGNVPDDRLALSMEEIHDFLNTVN